MKEYKKILMKISILVGLSILIGIIFGNINKKVNNENVIKSIKVEYNDKMFEIADNDDINKIENILGKLKYNLGICKGERTHMIICNSEIYYIKKGCKEVQKGSKQAEISQDDLNALLKIIESN